MITGEQMLNAMEAAVAERGDSFHYPALNDCQYYYDPVVDKFNEDGGLTLLGECFGDEPQPACLVGLALHLIDPALLMEIYNGGGNAASVDAIWLFEDRSGNIKFQESALVTAKAGQVCQDKGGSWGEALVAAKEALIDFRNDNGDVR